MNLCPLIAAFVLGLVLAASAQPKGPPQRNVLIFVADGLRADSVNPKDAPTFARIRRDGVNFINPHSLFPTVTTVNASAIATGHYIGDTGNFGNSLFVGRLDFGKNATPFLEDDAGLG